MGAQRLNFVWRNNPPSPDTEPSARQEPNSLASLTTTQVTAGQRGHALFASCLGIPSRVVCVDFASKYSQKSCSVFEAVPIN